MQLQPENIDNIDLYNIRHIKQLFDLPHYAQEQLEHIQPVFEELHASNPFLFNACFNVLTL